MTVWPGPGHLSNSYSLAVLENFESESESSPFIRRYFIKEHTIYSFAFQMLISSCINRFSAPESNIARLRPFSNSITYFLHQRFQPTHSAIFSRYIMPHKNMHRAIKKTGQTSRTTLFTCFFLLEMHSAFRIVHDQHFKHFRMWHREWMVCRASRTKNNHERQME